MSEAIKNHDSIRMVSSMEEAHKTDSFCINKTYMVDKHPLRTIGGLLVMGPIEC